MWLGGLLQSILPVSEPNVIHGSHPVGNGLGSKLL